MNIGELM
jgi:hypothetical protein